MDDIKKQFQSICTAMGHVVVLGTSQQTHFYNIYTMLDQRGRRWADVVEMLYKCLVFAGMDVWNIIKWHMNIYIYNCVVTHCGNMTVI